MPVYVSNEDIQHKSIPAEQCKECTRIYHDALKAKMSAGSVCVYLTGPDGKFFVSKTVPEKAKLLGMIESAIETLQLKSYDKPAVRPKPQSVVPKVADDAIVLHLVAPYEQRKGSWQDVPAESWIPLSRAEWSKFLPAAQPELNASWEIDATLAAKIYNQCYPATEDTRGNQIDRNVIQEQSLKATIERIGKDGIMRARLDGALKMTRPFYPGHPEHKPAVITAAFTGYFDFEPGKELRAFKFASTSGTFNTMKFNVGARLVIPDFVIDFEDAKDLENWSDLKVEGAAEPAASRELSKENATRGDSALKLTFKGGNWPAIVTVKIPESWEKYQSFKADVTVSRTCVVGFRAMQEKSTRKDGWDDVISRWEKTAILRPGTTEISAVLHPNEWSAVLLKFGRVTSFEIYMYAPHQGEGIFVDNIRLSPEKLPSVEKPKTKFKVLGTDYEVSGVKELGDKLKAEWKQPETKTVEQIETEYRAKLDELKKSNPNATLAILRDGEKNFDAAQPQRVYAGWKDAYWSSHGPDSNTFWRTQNRGKAGGEEIFMRHRSPLMQVDLNVIPKGSKILSAALVIVRSTPFQKSEHPNQPNMWVAEVCNRPWEEYEVNAYQYAKDKFWREVGGMYYGDDPDFLPTYLAHGPSQGMVNSWDFTNAVKYWVEDGNANHGFMLHGDSKDWLGRAHFRESTEQKNRPALLIIYAPK